MDNESLGVLRRLLLGATEIPPRAERGRFVCVTSTLGQGRRSGLQLSLTAYAVVTVEDHKIRRIAIAADRGAAIEAAGLSE